MYIQNRFFYSCIAIMVLFVVSFVFPKWFNIVRLLLLLLVALTFLDGLILFFAKQGIRASRHLPEKFSNGDQNPIRLKIENFYTFPVYVRIIDEIPEQFQVRNFKIDRKLEASSMNELQYELRPVERGEYHFGKLNVYVTSIFGLVARRFTTDDNAMVPTYPSFIQLRKYDLLAISNNLHQYGIKKIRRIGHTMEFEQIKDYVAGDDVRSINWKATAKRGGLMVNQYQDERSQPVYSVIDTGRTMKMPFEHLKLLDYAINSALAFSNIALKKKDKAGLITFSNKMEKILPASSKKTHLNLLLESLYNVSTQFKDSDFGLLYTQVNRILPQRSLLLLYTNFEHLDALHRQMPYLLALAKKHLLVVIFFENTELESFINKSAKNIPEVFNQTIAEQFSYDKRLMAKELQKHGIQTILTRPKDLTVNTINKYLEIKKRGIL